MAGRAGADIASSLTAIVEMLIKDNPNIVNLVTWSDSCVPQNRNEMICYSMLDMIRKNQQLEAITLKYSIPGHSSVQEVDNMHSKIERAMNVAEFFSPVSFLSILLKCHRQKPYKVTQLQERHFKEFSQASSSFEYSAVPFSKVVSLRLTREHDKVFYKTSRLQKTYKEANIVKKRNSQVEPDIVAYPTPRCRKQKHMLSKEKAKDLREMMKYMGHTDKVYYDTIIS